MDISFDLPFSTCEASKALRLQPVFFEDNLASEKIERRIVLHDLRPHPQQYQNLGSKNSMARKSQRTQQENGAAADTGQVKSAQARAQDDQVMAVRMPLPFFLFIIILFCRLSCPGFFVLFLFLSYLVLPSSSPFLPIFGPA